MEQNSQRSIKKKLTIIDPEAAAKAMQLMQEGKFGELPAAAFEIDAYDLPPLPGFEEAPNFPDCCPYHKRLLEIGKERYELFPDCCIAHKRLHTAHWFEKSKYAYLPLKLVTTLAYTKHCIFTALDRPEWFKEITDYIEEMKN